MSHSPAYSRIKQGSKRNTWHWHRPNGERVPLYGFNHKQIHHITPALHAVDVHLRPQHRLNAYAHLKKPTLFSAFSRATQPKNAALTYANRPFGRKDKIEIHSSVFKKRSTLHPSGVFAHELGHLVGPDSRKGNHVSGQQLGEFRSAFGYKRGGFMRRDNVSSFKKSDTSILRGRKTRQSHNAHEDFAETFRASIGVPILNNRATLKHQAYFNTAVDPARREYLRKHYIW